MIACMCFSLRPVRMHMDIDTNMKLIGKRFPYLATYKVCMYIYTDYTVLFVDCQSRVNQLVVGTKADVLLNF